VKQILQSFRNGELWLADVPVPQVGDRSVLIQTSHSLVSAGTERMLTELAKKSLLGKARARPDLVRKVWQRVKTDGLRVAMTKAFAKLDAPITMGYSCAGTVVEVGRQVTDLQPGDRVACGGAGYATHAEFNVVPRNLVARIPDGVSTQDACFTTVGAIAMQGVRQADVRLGERVVVTGLGLLGLLTVQILKASGCAVLGVDPDAGRCALAEQLGADRVQDGDPVEVAQAWTEGRGVDAVVVTASTDSDQPLHDAAAMLRHKGRVVVVGVVGMNVPRDDFYRKELDLRLSMSYGPGRYDRKYEELGEDYPFGLVRWTEQRNLQCFVDLLARGAVTPGPLVSGQFQIDQGLQAYEALSDRGQLGIVLAYPSEPSQPARTVPLVSRADKATPGQSQGVGLIGAGAFAKGVLLPAIGKIAGLDPVGICTERGMSASQTGQRFGFEYATTDAETLFADERVGAVVITTRHDSHADLVVRALGAGKHVFVEKPLCLDPGELDGIDAAVAAGPGQLSVGYNRRFSSHAQALSSAFGGREGPMVIQYRVNAGRVPQDSWIQDPKHGGGRIVGEVCHFLDFCQALVGAELRTVHAAKVGGGDQRSSGDDSVAITLTYADGSLASILYLADGAGTLEKERVEVHAGGISAVVEDFQTTRFHGCSARRVSGPQDKGFDAELRAFLQSAKGGQPPSIPYAALRETSLASFAVLESLRVGKRVVVHRGSAVQGDLDE